MYVCILLQLISRNVMDSETVGMDTADFLTVLNVGSNSLNLNKVEDMLAGYVSVNLNLVLLK